MKKIVALLLGLLMVFGVCSAMAEATTVNPGAELSFDISISSPSGTDAKIGIKTNGAPVTFKSATGGPTNDVVPPKAFDGFFVLVNDAGISIPGNGGSISGTPAGPVTLESGKVGTVTFTVNAAATAGTYTVEAYKKEGSITVTGSITCTVKAAATGDKLLGDVTGDGKIDGRDQVRLMKYLVDDEGVVEIIAVNSDMNEDGKINGIDTIRLMKLLVSMDE